MKTHILTPQDFQTSQWSGGSTTQLYISPANSSYSDKNFDLRISTAKIEVEESNFTSLTGVYRKLMILEGEITIQHENEYSKKLKPFDVDVFSGDWKTSSIGTCTDFNVMTTKHQQSEFYHLAQKATETSELKLKSKCRNLFLYATSGNLIFQIMDENYKLRTGNLMVIENIDVSSLSMKSDVDFTVVVLEVM